VGDEDRWGKLEEIVRRVVREEVALLGKKQKLEFVNGRWVGITQEQREAWAAAYGAVDIEAELKKAAAWIVSNPHLAPKSQYGRFLNTWLSRTQNVSSIRSIQTRNDTGPGKKLCAYCEKVALGSVNQIWYCNDHSRNAMDRDPIPHMMGIEPKAVAGRD
jgi:hypothetical protein